MKKRKHLTVFVVIGFLLLPLTPFFVSEKAEAKEIPLIGERDEIYYMVSFLSEADFWKGCYLGFKEAADLYHVKTVYAGTPEYEITKAVTAFEQVVAQQPTGIALTCMNPEPFVEPINKAMEQGIKVVTFDADSPRSKRLTFISTDNPAAGRLAADAFAEVLGYKGEVGILERPGQLNVERRLLAFKEQLEKKYSDIKIVRSATAGGSQQRALELVTAMIQANPDLKGIFSVSGIEAIGASMAVKEAGKEIKIMTFDTPAPLLDMIKDGEVWATGGQNTYLMGYFSMICLYHAAHELINPLNDWKENPDVSPLPSFINTGLEIITRQNVDDFYLRD